MTRFLSGPSYCKHVSVSHVLSLLCIGSDKSYSDNFVITASEFQCWITRLWSWWSRSDSIKIKLEKHSLFICSSLSTPTPHYHFVFSPYYFYVHARACLNEVLFVYVSENDDQCSVHESKSVLTYFILHVFSRRMWPSASAHCQRVYTQPESFPPLAGICLM